MENIEELNEQMRYKLSKEIRFYRNIAKTCTILLVIISSVFLMYLFNGIMFVRAEEIIIVAGTLILLTIVILFSSIQTNIIYKASKYYGNKM